MRFSDIKVKSHGSAYFERLGVEEPKCPECDHMGSLDYIHDMVKHKLCRFTCVWCGCEYEAKFEEE